MHLHPNDYDQSHNKTCRGCTGKPPKRHAFPVASAADSLPGADCLQFVLVLGDGVGLGLEALALAHIQHDHVGGRVVLQGVVRHLLPVVEHALGEGLAGSGGTQGASEAEGLHHGQVRLQVKDGGAHALLLLEHQAALLVEHRVHAAQGALRALDLHQVHGLAQPGVRRQHRGVQHPAAGGDDLATAAVDGIRVQHHIVDLEHNTAHVLLAQHTLLGGPLEGGHAGVLDLIQVLHTLGDIGHQVRAHGVRTEGPDLLGELLVPPEVVHQHLAADLGVVAGADLAIVNGLSQTLLHRPRREVQPVVLVGGLGHADVVGLAADGLAEGHHGI
mmetsp:Transcript_13005/g.39379  ORF Transcript_13005/g.39379 Transcript_13005/m.39379 type:complete len:330 (-) Transcript_13005:1846-2835(-)